MKKLIIHMALMLALFATYAVAQAGSPAGQAPGEAGAEPQQQDQGAAEQQQSGYPQAQSKDKDKDKDKVKGEDKEKDKGARVDDQQLERQVRQQLSSRPEFQNIEVSVKNAVVDLKGSVPKKDDRKEAAELAKAVPGVRRVREHLSIGAPRAGEAATASKQHEEAGETPGEEAAEKQQGEKAPAGQNTAGSIAGNTSEAAGEAAGAAQQGTTAGVTGQSGATGQASGADAQVQSQIQQAIQSQPALASSNVNVNIINNQVILSGAVASDQAKQQAEQIAQQHAGSMQVINNINVGSSASASSGATGGVSGAATGAQTQAQQPGAAGAGAVGAPTQETVPQERTSETGGMAPDQLKAQLDQALQKEPTLASCNISSNVNADSIELSGSCPTGKEKETARRMAQSLAGNRRVVDRITVTGRGQGENQDKNQVPPQF